MSFTGVAFVLVFLIGCTLAFLRHPVWGAALYVSTFFVGPQQHWWGQGMLAEVRWAYIAAIVTLLAILFNRNGRAPSIPLTRHGAFWLMALFVVWLAVESLWALAPAEQWTLLTYYFKFTVALALIYRCVDSEESLKVLLWTLFGCCFYLGWIAYTSYSGGRFEDFGGAGLSEANAAALALSSGALLGASLFLAGRMGQRLVVVGGMPFILNGIVTTISRSGSLALAAGGLVFNLFAPRRLAGQVRVLSVLAVILFLILAGSSYWLRMQSLEHAGQNVEGLDTGEDRVEIIKAQFRMFAAHPFGCGAACTAVLSPRYLPARYLSRAPQGEQAERASHNTFMTMLVEHGIPGALFYLALLAWTLRSVRRLARGYRDETGFAAVVFPGVVGVLGGILIGDMFVSYARFEIRYWCLALLMAMLAMQASRQSAALSRAVTAEGTVPGLRGARAIRAAVPRAAGDRETQSGSR